MVVRLNLVVGRVFRAVDRVFCWFVGWSGG